MRTRKEATERWSTTALETIKRSVKRELDTVDPLAHAKVRLQHAMRRIAELEDDPKPVAQLRRFVLVISSLVHHARHGGLKPTQVRRAAELASTLLVTHGIEPGTSRLAMLHGELHLVLSQIYRKAGGHWHAAWEQHEAIYKARRALPGGSAFQAMALGNRLLRLGHARLAIKSFEEAEAGDLAVLDREKVRLARLKATRLTGDQAAAEALIKQTEQDLVLSEGGRRELAWERLCLGIRNGALAEMLASLRRDKPHYEAIYMLEASLWTKAVEKREWLERMITVRSIAKKQGMKPHRFGGFHRLATVLDRAYDLEVPLILRIRDLGQILARSDRLTTVDKELLAWVAAARFLARSQAYHHAGLALAEYVALSLRLSEGKVRDVLGIAGDLLERDWFSGVASDHCAA